MWDRVFPQRANIGITRSCMHWYVRKNDLTWVKTGKFLSGVVETIWLDNYFLSTDKNAFKPLHALLLSAEFVFILKLLEIPTAKS